MVLIGVVPESFGYGFIGVVMTHIPWLGPAWIHFLFYGITAYAVHRCDVETAPDIQPRCETLLRDMLPYQVIPTWIGVFLGMAFVWAVDFPRLVSYEAFFDHPFRSTRLGGHAHTLANTTAGGGDAGTPHNAKSHLWTWLLIVAGMAGGVSIYFFEERFTANCIGEPELTSAQQLAVAVPLLIVAIVLALTYVCALVSAEASDRDYPVRRLPDGHVHSAVLNAKYIVLFSLLYSLPAIYDLTRNAIPSPWARWGIQVAAMAVLLAITFFAGANLGNSWSGDRYLGTMPAPEAAAKLFALWAMYTIVYLSAPLADTGSGFGGATPVVRDAVIWVGILGGSLFVITVIVGACLRSGRDEALAKRDADVVQYLRDERQSDTTQLLVPSTAHASVHTMHLRHRRSHNDDDSSEFDI